MIEFKGTKGKWKVDKCEKDSSGRACYRIHTYIRPMDSQMKYNAQLISKAPEMYEMLKTLLDNSDVPNEIYDQAKQLIKEATTI